MLHAQDYLVYAHLQKANEAAAREVMDFVSQLGGPWDQNALGASAYTFASIPARFALERRDFATAATLEARQPASFPWSDGFAAFEAIAWFGRGLGAAINGQEDVALGAVEELNRLKDILTLNGDAYWATQLDIQINSVTAWNTYRQGDTENGLAHMQRASELENGTFKHPITPGELLPANELYGDMLLELGDAENALAAYQRSMDRSPGRFNSLYGAGMAADKMGDRESAINYFASLIEMTKGSEADWPRLQSAREYVTD
jgi:tetratricopeptide (TPR) repeat protein